MPRRSASSRPASLPYLRWSPAWAFRLDPAPSGGALECQSRSGSALAWSSFNSQLINPNMDNNTPSFAERIAALKAAAEAVMLEAQRMEAAARKFDKRRQQKASR
jgi:hypothetical protein